MQRVASHRAAAPCPHTVAFGGKKARRAQQQRQQRQLNTVAVAQMEEVETGLDADDKAAAYARFEQLLDEFTFSFKTGDKVGSGRRARIGAGRPHTGRIGRAARRHTHRHMGVSAPANARSSHACR